MIMIMIMPYAYKLKCFSVVLHIIYSFYIKRSFFDLAFSNALVDSMICSFQLWIRLLLLRGSNVDHIELYIRIFFIVLHHSMKGGIVLIYYVEKNL
ncbi:hypothetical protein QL285_003131 [Trifolium repens]|nr:hypothetical protein QL285_003131 [Trifolium repens]